MPGHEDRQWRENVNRLVNRKQGEFEPFIVTQASIEFDAQWRHLMHRLPLAPAQHVQNPDGSFPYLPGYDGPL